MLIVLRDDLKSTRLNPLEALCKNAISIALSETCRISRGKHEMVLRKYIMALSFRPPSALHTLDGRPTQVMMVKEADTLIASYRPNLAIQAPGTIPATNTATRYSYRNRVIAASLTTINAHYQRFVRDLSRSGKGCREVREDRIARAADFIRALLRAADEVANAAAVQGGPPSPDSIPCA